MPTPAKAAACWVLSDGRRGIENQALGLAEACQRIRPISIKKQIIESGAAFKAATPHMQFTMRGDPVRYGLTAPFPDIAIGCGRQAIAPLMALKKACGDGIFTVYVQDPRIDPAAFDLVIAPEHDGLTGDNVISMIGAPNRITRTELISQVLSFQDKLSKLPMPRASILIGGDSKTHRLSKKVHKRHMKAAADVISSGRSLLLTTSRRTPDWAAEQWQTFAAKNDNVWLYEGGEPNPYIAFLGGSDTILVTEDSTNMLTDACATGKSVFTLPMDGKPGKFSELYERLNARCHVAPYDARFKSKDYAPLDETARMAHEVWTCFDGKRVRS